MAWEITVNTCDPLKARQWFKLRDPVNWGIIILVFVPLVFVLQIFLPYFICDVIVIAAAFSLYFFGLHKRAIGIECPSCGKYILTNTPWICGVCGAKNLRVDDFPFVGRCENKDCGVEPKAYQCHHCEKLIFFTPDRQRINYAKCVNLPVKSKPAGKGRRLDPAAELNEGIHITKLKVDKAKLDVELKGLNATLEPVKFKTIKERLRSGVMSKSELDDEVRRMKAEADEEFKNDPVGREKRYRQIEEEATGLL
jgi:hypothetical protein